jgi:flagellar export protein FliJ
MAFKFPLATVLRVRESIERREEIALEKIQMEMARIQHRIDAQDAFIAELRKAQGQALGQAIPAGQLQSMEWEVQTTDGNKSALLVAMRTLSEQRDVQMKIYQAAHRDHETLLSMYKEQREVYEREQERLQQRSLDDIFMARRHGRQEARSRPATKRSYS